MFAKKKMYMKLTNTVALVIKVKEDNHLNIISLLGLLAKIKCKKPPPNSHQRCFLLYKWRLTQREPQLFKG